jgi:hypothetical protein
VKILWIVGISLLAGLLGRLGGVGKPWDTKMRDLGVPACLTIALLVLGLNHSSWGFWWLVGAYFCQFGLVFGSCTTYLDSIFGYDNFWASGALVGLASFPIAIVTGHWWLFAARAILLAVIWGSLNRWLPERILFWHRDTVEEFCRYAVVILTCWLI